MSDISKPPHAVDLHIGLKIRSRRRDLRISQHRLGEAIGVSFQQIQKYERGTNRVSASMLVKMASVLEVTPGWFIDDAPDAPRTGSDDGAWREAAAIVFSIAGTLDALRSLAAMPADDRETAVHALRLMAEGAPRDKAA